MKVLITGGNGYIAKSLTRALKSENEVTTVSRYNFDLTSFTAVSKFFQEKFFDIVIHTAVSGGSRIRADTVADMDNNLTMYYNLLQHREHYGKFIHFGSGAELFAPETPYGISKRVIAQSMLERDRFYNLKIFGLFDENELDTRFIKANLKRYISKAPMIVDVDKKMTFFYMKDLILLVKHYINTVVSELIPEVYCAYSSSYTLLETAEMINKLSNYRVPIYVKSESNQNYSTNITTGYKLPYIGFEKGLIEVYTSLT